MRHLFFEELLKSLQIVSVDIGNSPVVEVRVNPMEKLIALARHRLRGCGRIRFCRPNKHVNEMFAPLVNQGCDRPVLKIIETATNQRKPFAGKVDDRRCEIELCVQPRFHGVLVGGSDVSKMICHQRTHMAGDELRRQELIGSRSLQSRQYVPADDGCEKDRRGETQPIPRCPKKNGPRLWLPSWERRLSISRNISHGPFGNLLSQRGLNPLTQFCWSLVIRDGAADCANQRTIRFVCLLTVTAVPQMLF